jgi:hypothetical protein
VAWRISIRHLEYIAKIFISLEKYLQEKTSDLKQVVYFQLPYYFVLELLVDPQYKKNKKDFSVYQYAHSLPVFLWV